MIVAASSWHRANADFRTKMCTAKLRRPVLFALAYAICSVALLAAKWNDLKPQELAAAKPANALSEDAEVLFSNVDISFDGSTTTKHCYRRLKVYSIRGVELVQKFGIENSARSSIDRLAARLTKPAGRSTEFAKGDFHVTDLVKLGGEKWTTRRLLLSTLAPGDIVEFQWEESWDGWAWFQFVFCQESLPVREFLLTVDVEYIMVNLAWYNTPPAKVKKTDASLVSLTIKNIPAYESEPDAPPELETRGYVLIAYGEVQNDQSMGWLMKAAWLMDYAKKHASPNGKIKALAESLCLPSDNNEEKHRKFYAYCQDKITNIDYDESPQSLKERVKRKDPRTAAEVLKDKRGDSIEINFLFAALAASVGTDARIVCLCPKDLLLNAKITNGWYFIAPLLVACREEGEWVFRNPGNPAQAFGELRWQEEGVTAILSDTEKLLEIAVPSTPARKNLTRRTAALQLSADGTLEGQATLNYAGQAGLQWRILHRKIDQTALEKELRDEIVARIPGAEVGQIHFENQQAPGKSLIIQYHLKIPNYSTGAGTRLFVVPNVFEVGAGPRYSTETRHQPFFYPYAYQIEDEVRIAIPTGLVPNVAKPPMTLSSDHPSFCQHISWQFECATNILLYKREFTFGTSGSELSHPQYVVRETGGQVDKKKPRLVLLYYLDENFRSRNSEAIELEPAETADVASVQPDKASP